jgi:hypothetical protein
MGARTLPHAPPKADRMAKCVTAGCPLPPFCDGLQDVERRGLLACGRRLSVEGCQRLKCCSRTAVGGRCVAWIAGSARGDELPSLPCLPVFRAYECAIGSGRDGIGCAAIREAESRDSNGGGRNAVLDSVGANRVVDRKAVHSVKQAGRLTPRCRAQRIACPWTPPER